MPSVVIAVPVVVEVVAVNPYSSAIPLVSHWLGVSQRNTILSKLTDAENVQYRSAMGNDDDDETTDEESDVTTEEV